MKFSIAIVFLFLASSTVAQEYNRYKYYVEAVDYLEECYEKIGFTDGHKGSPTVMQEKCGLACLFTAFKLMNEDGSINIEGVLTHSKTLTAEKLNEYVERCKKEGGYNAQSANYACEIAACFEKNNFFSDVD